MAGLDGGVKGTTQMAGKEPRLPLARPGRRHAHFRQPRDVVVAVDGEIVAVPIGERRAANGHLHIAYTADDDAVGMALDDFFHLEIDRSERADPLMKFAVSPFARGRIEPGIWSLPA